MSAAREQMEHELLEVEKKYKDSLNQLMEAERKGMKSVYYIKFFGKAFASL